MTGDLSFNYEDLHFIELQEVNSKFPARSWGGYSQDYGDADRVYRHEDVQIHPSDAWGIVGIEDIEHGSTSLLIFDLDVHKAPDDFDPDDLSLPANTPIIRSQSGGFHVLFMIHEPRGAGAESDFQMTADLGWDIDIRGSYVSHHVVAPADIPGVGGDYEIVNDDTIAGVFDPADAAERIRYQGDPLLEVDRDTSVGDFTFDRPTEAPDEMPTCYHAGLELRKAAPADHPNTHKVNVLTALCGLAAGYSVEDVAEHFCGEWAPKDGDVDLSDMETTEYQVAHIAEKLEDGEYSPPALSTLRDYGILDESGGCGCQIDYHGSDGRGSRHTGTRRDTVAECAPPAVDAQAADVDAIREQIRGPIYDEFLDRDDAPTVLAHDPGAGKTTTSHLAADDRDRDLAFLFDKHRKAHEHRHGAVVPDVDLHLRGAAQPREEACAQAAYEGEACTAHGEHSNCPRMCPIYDQRPDAPERQTFEAVAAEVGPVMAHVILEPHDGEACAWYETLQVVGEADTLVGVHEYQRLKTVRAPDGATRDVLVDESPGELADDRRLAVEDLVRLANTLEDWTARSAAGETLRRFGQFARDVADAVIDGDALAELDAPVPVWDAYEAYDDAAGNYMEFVEPGEGWQRTEALVRAKRAFIDHQLAHLREDGADWDQTPLAIDALLAAAIEAGLDADSGRAAAGHPFELDTCPRCHSALEHASGHRHCEGCDWTEDTDLYTAGETEPARILAWIDADPHAVDTRPGLVRRRLPAPSELPDAPLVLDATATPEKIAAMYGVDQDDVAVHGADQHALENLHVTQILDGQYHYSTLAKAAEEGRTTADRIQHHLDQAGTLHDRPLVVGRREVRDLFDLPDNAEFIHFHGARGLNFEECDAVVVIGAPHPDMADIERTARLLAQGRDDLAVGGDEHSTRQDAPNPPVYRKLRYTDDDGRGRAVATKHYTGLVGALFREAREKELEQVIHRIRPLLADEMNHAYLLTNVPTDVPVDEVCTLEELAEPAAAMLPVTDGALNLATTLADVAADDGPDGFRAATLVERDGDSVQFHIQQVHRLAQLTGQDVTERTVRRWIDDLEALGLVDAGDYLEREGVAYSTDGTTLTRALSVLTSNDGVEVAVKRRLAALAEDLDSVAAWLRRVRGLLDLRADAEAAQARLNGGDRPPDDPI